MSINNIGGSLPIPLNDTEKKEDESPDNYPSYGNKSGMNVDLPLDEIHITPQQEEKSPPAEEAGRTPEAESPDNYPSYGNKVAKEEAPPPEKEKKALDPSIIIDQQVPAREEFYLAQSPDNYPSYGDK